MESKKLGGYIKAGKNDERCTAAGPVHYQRGIPVCIPGEVSKWSVGIDLRSAECGDDLAIDYSSTDERESEDRL